MQGATLDRQSNPESVRGYALELQATAKYKRKYAVVTVSLVAEPQLAAVILAEDTYAQHV